METLFTLEEREVGLITEEKIDPKDSSKKLKSKSARVPLDLVRVNLLKSAIINKFHVQPADVPGFWRKQMEVANQSCIIAHF